MADLKYTATLDDQISPKLKKIEDNTRKVTDKMAQLGGVIAGLAIGAAVTNAVRFADSIQDITNATGIATNAVLGFTNALQNNGGSAEQASQAIYKFVQTIGEAANGGKNAQNAFKDVGVTLNDLATLSEQDILAKTIDGLSKIEDVGQRAAIQTELLGKGFRGIDVKGVAGSLAQSTIAAAKYSESIRQASDMQGKFDLAMQKFQLAVLKATEPFVKFINNLDDDTIEKTITTVVDLSAKIGALAVALYTAEKAITAVGAILAVTATAFAAFKVGLVGAAAGFALLTRQVTVLGLILKNLAIFLVLPFTTLTGVLGRVALAFTSLAGVGKMLLATFVSIGAGLMRMIPFVGLLTSALFILNDAFRLITGNSLVEWIGKGIDKIKEFLGISSKIAEDQSQAETARLARQNKLLANQDKEKAKIREVQDAYEAQRKKLEEISQNYAKQNGLLIKNIDFETRLIGKSEDQIELQRALNDLQSRGADEIDKLRSAKQNLSKEEMHLAGLYDEQIKKIQAQTQADAIRLTNSITGLQQANNQEKARLNLIEATTKQLDQQAALEERLRGATQDLQREMESFNIEGMTDAYDRGLAEIKTKTDNRITDLRKSFEGMMDEANMDPSDVQRYTEALIQLEAQVRKLGQAEQERFMKNNPTTFAEGWSKAYEEYAKNASNAATRGRDAFTSVMGNMNSAIDNFVDTGKFRFGDFARSIIQDLIKIELKAAASKLFSSMFSSAGGWLSSLLGFANGGTPPLNKPSIVGENGPELFVPRSAGTVVPGKEVNLGGGVAGSGSVINNTYNSYNISAVDAKSVAQLFAENRKTLLGTVRMAEKEMPYGR